MSETNTLKSVALNDVHIALGAKMVPFAGYSMPLQYSNLIQEHNAVRNSVGVFDVSHMGEFVISGDKAIDLLQWVTSNDVSKLENGKIQYSCLPNEQGGIVDDLLVYRINEKVYLLVVNASNMQKDWDWIKNHNKFGAEMLDISDQTSLLAVQGPNALKVVQKLTDVNLSEIPYYSFVYGKVAGIENVLISCTGYTGAGGFELYVQNQDIKKLWDAVFEAGKEFGIMPCGLGSRDTLRLEKGFCLYGNDIDDTTSPIEAGLGWITKFNKDFVNKAYHEKIKTEGPTKKLVGFEMIDKGIPRHDYLIKNEGGETIGRVTSGTQSPSLNKAIGLGYVAMNFNALDSEIFIDIRGKLLKAKIIKIPFL
ncbi:MAG: glycine cleavage system aminomethyltransferase GcvT [Bacteroidetes bacterium]|nr:glycine cleavage system aminomethyltransferase GcvT [Bacteroidota bacterium]